MKQHSNKIALGIFSMLFLLLTANADEWISSNSTFNGTYYQTYLNESMEYIQLNESFTDGWFSHYTFDSGNTSTNWSTISWTSSFYGIELEVDVNTIALYHFNEPSGVLVDESGVNNCTSTGGVTYSVDGKFNDSLLYDGSTGYLNCGNNTILDIDNITISTWVYPTVSQDADIVEKNGAYVLWLDKAGATLFANCRIYVSASYSEAISTTDLDTLNQWYNVVCTYNGSTVTMYVNGIEEDTTAQSGSPDITDDDLVFGFQDFYFGGRIDETVIYDYAINDSEVLDMYNRGVSELNISVRSCDDENCSGETWNETFTSDDEQSLSVSLNRFFQWNASFFTETVGSSPVLNNVSIVYQITTSTTSTSTTTTTSLPTSGIEFIVLDYDTMNGIENAHIRVYINPLENDNFTDVLGKASMELSNGSKSIVVTHGDYISISESENITGVETFVYKMQNITTYSIISLELDDIGLNYALCIDNLTNCYPSGTPVLLTEKRDYAISLVPSEMNITLSTVPTLFTNIVEPLMVLSIIIIVVVGIFYAMKRNILK